MRNSIVILVLAGLLAGCGGTGTSPAPTPTSGGAPAGGAVSPPIPVSAVGGSETGGVNISVPAPAASPQPNVEALGLGSTASNTGAIVHLGSTQTVIVFGPGLNGSMNVSISGPSDITISNQRQVTSTTGVPGIAFDIQIAANAALGARTVFFQSTQHDITAFTGGLEVQP